MAYTHAMEHEESLQKFGPVLRRLREEAGLTQEELAFLVGHSTPSYMGFLETGVRYPTLHMVLRLAHALGMPASVLIAEMEK